MKNALLVIASILIALCITEFALRTTLIGKYSLNDRVLFYSAPSFIDRYENVRYESNSRVRTVAIYGDNIDYDTTNITNNMGFYDNVSYQESGVGIRDIGFLGDSLTSGSGSDVPWVTQMRQLLDSPETRLYNLGVAGTGIFHFRRLLKYFDHEVPLDEVNIMAISDDFFRPLWYPQQHVDGTIFCPGSSQQNLDECLTSRKPVIYFIKHVDNDAVLLARAQEIYRNNEKNRDGGRSIFKSFRLYSLLCDAYFSLAGSSPSLEKKCPHLSVFQFPIVEKNELYASSLDQLKGLLSEHSKLKFRLFHIPGKSEVSAGRYFIDIAEDIQNLGLEYVPLLHSCDWQASMFHKHDRHPNNSGYSNLANCMIGYLQ